MEEEKKKKRNNRKTKHVMVDVGRPNTLRKFRRILLPSGEFITRHDAKKIAKGEEDEMS